LTESRALIIFLSVLLYIMFITGAVMVFFDRIQFIYNRLIMMRRLKSRKREYRKEGSLEKRLRLALNAVLCRSLPPRLFISAVFTFFLTIFIISIKTLTLMTAFTVSLITASLPCLLIWIRLQEIRRKGSYEGEALIAEFLRQYRMTNYNVYETLQRLIGIKDDIKYTGKLLFNLLIKLRETGNSRKIKKAADDFALSVNSNWSRMLAHNIYIAADKGTNVSLSVEDILIQLREARFMAEERKRLNNESVRMTYFMVPITYIATVVMAVRFLDLPFGRFVHNQFLTPGGLILILLIFFLFIVNIGLISLVTNQRFDY